MTQAFHATEEELGLATQILASLGVDADNGVLHGEPARTIFIKSALPSLSLRDIWDISDTNKNGELSKVELAMALRLIGWVQAGEMLRIGLLAKGICCMFRVWGGSCLSLMFYGIIVGPLPVLDGITDIEYNRSRKDEASAVNLCNSNQSSGPLSNRSINGMSQKAGPPFHVHSKDPSLIPPSEPKLQRMKSVPVVSSNVTTPALARAVSVRSPPLSPSYGLPHGTVVTPIIVEDDEWNISPRERSNYELYFRKLDESCRNYLEKDAFSEFVSIYRLSVEDLDKIW